MKTHWFTRLTRFIGAPIAYLHEGLHVFAARIFRVPYRRGFDYVDVTVPPKRWQMLVILLAPAAVGAIFLAASSVGWWWSAQVVELSTRAHLAWSCAVWVSFWWVAMCWYDFQAAASILRSRTYPEIHHG
jgi:hypothetical protein